MSMRSDRDQMDLEEQSYRRAHPLEWYYERGLAALHRLKRDLERAANRQK